MVTNYKNARIGDTISFGSYWKNSSSYKKPIEWRVLDVKDGKALLISKYALDCQSYNEKLAGVTWETCTLRKWLNSTFINSAFTLNEQEIIVTTTVTADVNPNHYANPGKDTQDKVFLLSIEEANKYFSLAESSLTDPGGNRWTIYKDRMCAATSYAVNQGVFINDVFKVDGKAACDCWLRSLGFGSGFAAFIDRTGEVASGGASVNLWDVGVRPALWISLENNETDSLKDDIVEASIFASSENNLEFKSIRTGDTISFGSYWQNSSEYKEPIEWRVLDVKNGKALLISKYALDCQPYNEEYKSVTWETCTLRRWLNSSFYNDAFSINEQPKISDVVVTADANSKFDTDPGNNTKDKIFLLSIDEVNKYFSSIKTDQDGNWCIVDRMCAPTQYAINQGVWASSRYKVDGKAACYWWLRSPGGHSDRAARVCNYGYVDSGGYGVDFSGGGVRPALWINLQS